MSIPNIVLIRIDNRLIHGQVATGWLKSCDANLAVVVNDDVSGNQTRQTLLKMAAPASVGVRFFSVDKTISIIGNASEKQIIALIVENPVDVLKLVKGGVPIREVNVGNMHMAEGKKKLLKTVYADQQEIEALKELVTLGVKVEARLLPSDLSKDMKSIIQGI